MPSQQTKLGDWATQLCAVLCLRRHVGTPETPQCLNTATATVMQTRRSAAHRTSWPLEHSPHTPQHRRCRQAMMQRAPDVMASDAQHDSTSLTCHGRGVGHLGSEQPFPKHFVRFELPLPHTVPVHRLCCSIAVLLSALGCHTTLLVATLCCCIAVLLAAALVATLRCRAAAVCSLSKDGESAAQDDMHRQTWCTFPNHLHVAVAVEQTG